MQPSDQNQSEDPNEGDEMPESLKQFKIFATKIMSQDQPMPGYYGFNFASSNSVSSQVHEPSDSGQIEKASKTPVKVNDEANKDEETKED